MSTTDQYPSYTLKFVTGDYVYRSILFKDPDPSSPDPSNPVLIPRDFTGWTGRAQIRKDTKRDTTVMATCVISFGLSGDPTDGYVVLELLEPESANVSQRGGWDLELTDPAGHAETVLGGPVSPTLDYTR